MLFLFFFCRNRHDRRGSPQLCQIQCNRLGGGLRPAGTPIGAMRGGTEHTTVARAHTAPAMAQGKQKDLYAVCSATRKAAPTRDGKNRIGAKENG